MRNADWLSGRYDGMAQLDNGEPAWPVARANGIAFHTFRQRLSRGWSGERAAKEPVSAARAKPPSVAPWLRD